jgi:NAD(P)-dependent dehydrogenase (short-subunit alcohol dehydrogenase family)
MEIRRAPRSAGPAEVAIVTADSVAELARLARVAVRPLVRRRAGALVCVVRHPPADDPARSALGEAAAAFVRSAAADLDYYGVPVSGVLSVDTDTDTDADADAARLAQVLAEVLPTGVGAGEVYLVTGTELARLAPPAVERELVRSDRRLGPAEVADALARSLPPAHRPGPPPGAGAAARVAIVTGGGGGIGRAVAAGLAAAGAAVVVADLGCDPDGAGRDPGPAAAVARDIEQRGGRAVAVCADVSRPAECVELVEETLRHFGRLDALCHAAGVVRPALVFESTDEDWDAVFGVHVTGAEQLVRSALPALRRHGQGRVVLFSSRSVAGSPGQTAYAAAKGAVLALGRSLAAELAGTGVTVSTVLPSGRTRASRPDRLDARRRRIELLRARHHGITDPAAYRAAPEQDPENNAAAVSWLCGEAGGAAAGRILGTGGWHVDLYRPSAAAATVARPAVITADHLRAL